ncbi:MAG: 23S rRNA (uracil(1939)-C(5))-methyltransferase RlmD [Solobacterium sp.]|nr:23S rRNA (uracil(1939)-C(5))-methyltransferase RlmD [Solobacterium sp.]
MLRKKEEKCPVSDLCGGCQYQGIPYRKQLKQKQQYTEKLLGGFYKVNPILGANNPLHYRNKVQVHFEKDPKGKIYMGNYVESTHQVVDVEDCMIASETSNHIFQTIKQLIQKYKINIFDEDAMRGFLRHVLIRTTKEEEVMVVLVTGTARFYKQKEFLAELLRRHPEITTVIQNINSRHTSMILGKKNIVLYGKGWIQDELCGYQFRISNHSFYQINHAQTEKLYQTAIHFAALTGKEKVLDAYCGIGTIGIILSSYAKEVDGVEINATAIQDAIKNARLNQVKNIHFTCEDASSFMKKKAKEKTAYDVVIVDPPRNGLEKPFIDALCKLKPKRVVYISCNPVTQKRDLQALKKHYEVRAIQPVDMFPYTSHIENVVLLTLKNEKKYQNTFKIGEDSMVATVHEFKTKEYGSLTVEREREFKSTYYVKK